MSSCLLPQLTLLPDSTGANAVVSTIFILAPDASQPPNVAISTCSYVLVDGSSASALEQASQPFDYVMAGAFWTFAFSVTVFFWFAGKNFGAVLDAIGWKK